MSSPAMALRDRTASALAGRFTHQLADVLAGRRPLRHVSGHVTRTVAGRLSSELTENANERPDYYPRSVHACLTTSSRVEVCAVLASRNRVRALVLRLEQENTQWMCTMFSVL